jgi:tetratricopeptide (TPR) repeat protein
VTRSFSGNGLARVGGRWRLAAALGFALVGLGIAAGAKLRNRGDPAIAPPLRGLEFAGCSAVSEGPVCELTEGTTLRVWLPLGAARYRIDADGAPLAPSRRADVQGGTLVHVAVPEGAHELRVTEEATGHAFHLALRAAPAIAWLDDAQELRDTGKLREACAAIGAHLATATGTTRARAIGLLARIHLAQGELDASVKELRDAIALDRQVGSLSAEADDTFALVFALDQRLFRFGEAREALTHVARALESYPEGRAREPFYDALLVADAYELHSAMLKFKEAERRAERLGMTRLEKNAQRSYAIYLGHLGRRSDALPLRRDLAARSEGTPPCDQVDLLDAVGLFTLRSLDAGEAGAPTLALARTPGTRGPVPPAQAPAPPAVDLEEAERALTSAAALFPGACPDVNRHAGVLLDLAEVAQRRGRLAVARERLAEARRSVPNPQSVIALAASALEARLDLDEGDPARALAAYEILASAAGPTILPEWRYATELGRGEAYEALGRFDEALASYAEAEATVNDQSLLVPMAEGRASFVADREKSARLRIDLLLRRGRSADALASARASRARPLAAFQRAARLERLPIEKRKEWERSIESYRRLRDGLEREAADVWKWSTERVARERTAREARNAELRAALDGAFSALAAQAPNADPPPPPRPDELIVAYHPGRDGWIGFGLSQRGLVTFRFDELAPNATPEETAERLLGPLRAELERAKQIRVLPYGALRRIDFHALPWNAAPLVESVAVTYGFDEPSPPPGPSAVAKAALIVADPSGDLPVAKREAEAVSSALRLLPGWTVRQLTNDEAVSTSVRDALGRASLFHYAGHGWFGGRAGFESALGLAEGGSLTVGDVLALPRVPGLVILAGCETARSTDDTGSVGLGLAHAFVAAGSRGVIAPVRPVEDSLAARVSEALYASFPRGDFDAAIALRAAQHEVRERFPDSDWAAFRLVTP